MPWGARTLTSEFCPLASRTHATSCLGATLLSKAHCAFERTSYHPGRNLRLVLYFSDPGSLNPSREDVQMHLGCLLYRVCMWIWLKPLYYRSNLNIVGCSTFWNVFVASPSGITPFRKTHQKHKSIQILSRHKTI